jgi:hypothetical protein
MLRWWPPWLQTGCCSAVAHDLGCHYNGVFRIIKKWSGKGAYLPNAIFLGFGEVDCTSCDVCEMCCVSQKKRKVKTQQLGSFVSVVDFHWEGMSVSS